MNEPTERHIPPRIFRVTFKTAEGITYWRWIKCPYQVRSPEDWADSLEGMQKQLANLVLEDRLLRFTVSKVAPERIDRVVRDHLHRWSEIYATVLAA